jgi:hypothetical protein
LLVVLFEADAAVAEPHNVAREVGQQHVEQVGSVHAEVVDGRRQGQHPGDGGSIRATVLRIGPLAPAHLDSLAQAQAPQYPHSVRREAEAGTPSVRCSACS